MTPTGSGESNRHPRPARAVLAGPYALSNVNDPAIREGAGLDVLNRLPDGWHLGHASYGPGTRRWSITAQGPHPGRGKSAAIVTGTGEDEIAAIIDLRVHLDERRKGERLAAIDRRGRLACLEGAEAQSQAAEGRPLNVDEPKRVARRYPDAD